MAEINSVVLVGRLTKDAEIKYTSGGMGVVKFTLAVNRRAKEGDTWVDKASFFNVESMGKAAEAVHKYLTKGKMIGVQGELRQDTWEKDGQRQSMVKIHAHSIQLLGSSDGKPVANDSSSPAQDFEDDIPF